MRRVVALSSLFTLSLLALFARDAVLGADNWASAESAGVVTDNDCGFVSAVAGVPLARRSGDTFRLHPADRLSGGDELSASPQGRVELAAGNNTVLVVGPDSGIRLQGIRILRDESGRETQRLDAALLRGGCRLQVRLNTAKPEAAMIATDSCDILLTRGDVAIDVQDGLRVSVLSGEASVRTRRGGATGSPLIVPEGSSFGDSGMEAFGGERARAIRDRLPFSFETETAALPPLPPMSYILEAP